MRNTFKWNKRLLGVFSGKLCTVCHTYPSGLPDSMGFMPFVVFELLYNSVYCRKRKVMQIILIYRNAKSVPRKFNWLLGKKASSGCVNKAISELLWSINVSALWILLWTGQNSFLVPSLINELSNAFTLLLRELWCAFRKTYLLTVLKVSHWDAQQIYLRRSINVITSEGHSLGSLHPGTPFTGSRGEFSGNRTLLTLCFSILIVLSTSFLFVSFH